MFRDYIPSTDADLVTWSDNFNTVIGTGYASYGLSSGQAAAYSTLNTAYANAYADAINPGTRTATTVAAKDTARNSLVAYARQLGQIARKYPGITDELLADAGLTVPDPIPSPIAAPTTSPVLTLQQSTSLTQVLKFKDSVLVNPRSKPAGATAMQLFRKIGTAAPASVADCEFVGNFSRSPMQIDFGGADALKNAYYIARWVTARGLVGPPSGTLTATIAA
jgi:hypothetical protein